MTNTNVCEDANDTSFTPIYYKSNTIALPKFLTFTQNDIISSAKDQMTFLKAFFNGRLFPKERLPELEKWNTVFFPFNMALASRCSRCRGFCRRSSRCPR